MSDPTDAEPTLRRLFAERLRDFERLPPDHAAAASSDVLTFMQGAVEAFRQAGLLSAFRAEDLRDEFTQPFVDMGFVTRVTASVSSSEEVLTARPRDGALPAEAPRRAEPRIERVIAGGQESISSDGRRVQIVAVVCWAAELEIDVIEFVPDDEQRDLRHRAPDFDWHRRWEVRDDRGRVYSVTGFGGGGGGGRFRRRLNLTPPLSSQASALTITPPDWRGDPVLVPVP